LIFFGIQSSQNTEDSRLNDEAIAKQLQLDEDAEVLPFHLVITVGLMV
jgi:hypothetical protein